MTHIAPLSFVKETPWVQKINLFLWYPTHEANVPILKGNIIVVLQD